MFRQHPGCYKAVFLKKTQTIILSFDEYTVYIHQYLFSFLATFHSFVNATYSDISVDCHDFYAGYCITLINNLILHCKKTMIFGQKNDNNTKFT
jgi:hypothetical protein